MIYKILIKGTTGMQYATQKVEITEKQIVDDQIVEVPTGKFKTDVFETNDKDAVKEKYIELLNTYKMDQLDVVADMKEIVTITVEIEDPDKKEEEVVTPPAGDDVPGEETQEPSGEETEQPTTPPEGSTGDDTEETETPSQEDETP